MDALHRSCRASLHFPLLLLPIGRGPLGEKQACNLPCSPREYLARCRTDSSFHLNATDFDNDLARFPPWVCFLRQESMSRGSKTKYTSKQKRKAEHIEESYERRGTPKKVAEKRAWQTVNKQSGGGEKSGGGRRTRATAKRAARKESGRRAARSRKVGSRRVQKSPTRHRASQSRKKS